MSALETAFIGAAIIALVFIVADWIVRGPE